MSRASWSYPETAQRRTPTRAPHMPKVADAPTLEWFRSLTAIADALNALEHQCTSAGFENVADSLRAAKASIAAAAEIIQNRAYKELESSGTVEGSNTVTKH